MSKSFHRANLRGFSFKGQDLSGVDFSYADIRGANFTKAKLIGANFSYCKAGLPYLWLIGLAVSAILLAGLGGFISGYASAFGAYVENLPAQYTILEKQVLPVLAMVLFIVLVVILLRRGLGAALAVMALTISAVIAIVAAAANVVIVATTLLQALVIAAAIAGIVTEAVAIALILGIGKPWSMVIVIVVAIAGAIPGIWEGVGEIRGEAFVLSFIVTGLITAILLALSVYMGWHAFTGDSKYFLIRALAIALLTKGGTSFRGANLMDAQFTHGILKTADLREAILTRTSWFQAKQLDYARTERTYLAHSSLRRLVTSKDGRYADFNHLDLGGLNLQGAKLTDASFIGANLSEATLQGADLSRAKLVHTQLYHTDLNGACLTGAYIEDWGISTDTQLNEVKCEYIYMQLPTPYDPDPCRKPDNKQEIFKEGDFSEFIAPIIKTLHLYRRQNIDLRIVAKAFKTLDIFHYEEIDPTATAIALKQLAEQHPEVGLEVIAMEGHGQDKLRLQTRVSGEADRSELSVEYIANYNQIKSLPQSELQVLLGKIAEKDERIRSLENMVMTAIKSEKFYAEAYYNFGETMSKKKSFHIEASGNVSGIVTGDIKEVTGDINFGSISGDNVNAIPSSTSPLETKIKSLFLAANPLDTERLGLDREIREIMTKIRSSEYRDAIELVSKWAVRPDDLLQALNVHKPQIVHFSGHGTNAGEIILVDTQGVAKPISTDALKALFATLKDNIKLIIFNACYSRIQAEAMTEVIDCAIGMSSAIGDEAAITFVASFYRAIGFGRSIQESFAQGVTALLLEGIPEERIPELLTRTGVNPTSITLVK